MQKTQTPQPATEDQLAKFQQVMRDRVRKGSVDTSRFQRVIGHDDLASRIDQLIDDLGYDPSDVLDSMRQFYRKFFGFDCPDLTGLRVPLATPGFNWALPIVAIHDQSPIEAAYQGLAKHFNCWKYTDRSLDEAVPKNDRDPRQGPYVIRLRDRVEADEEFKNLSANDLAGRQMKMITLYERLILEGWYFAETGKHLDIQNITLCSGSRDDAGHVPDVLWYSDDSGLRVDWCGTDSRNDYLRVREVVS